MLAKKSRENVDAGKFEFSLKKAIYPIVVAILGGKHKQVGGSSIH